MATNTQFSITTDASAQTRKLGQHIGRLASPGIVFALNGDLGTGKTTLTQGIAKGLEVPDEYYITSPSYTLVNQYPGRLPLYHIDLYRIETAAALEDIGLYDILVEEGIIVIEWADKLDAGVLTEYISADMKFVDENVREIRLDAYGLKETDLLKKLSNISELFNQQE